MNMFQERIDNSIIQISFSLFYGCSKIHCFRKKLFIKTISKACLERHFIKTIRMKTERQKRSHREVRVNRKRSIDKGELISSSSHCINSLHFSLNSINPSVWKSKKSTLRKSPHHLPRRDQKHSRILSDKNRSKKCWKLPSVPLRKEQEIWGIFSFHDRADLGKRRWHILSLLSWESKWKWWRLTPLANPVKSSAF